MEIIKIVENVTKLILWGVIVFISILGVVYCLLMIQGNGSDILKVAFYGILSFMIIRDGIYQISHDVLNWVSYMFKIEDTTA